MKNKKFEFFYRNQKEHQRRSPWKLHNGLYVPHRYPDEEKDRMTQWDDVGFVMNGRRVMVWFVHPRRVYLDKLDDIAHDMAGGIPERIGDDFFSCKHKNYKKLGRSRKKVVSYSMCPTLDALSEYIKKLQAIEERLKTEGIDFEVTPSWSSEPLSWSRGVNLVAPFEIQSASDLIPITSLVRALLKQEVRLEDVFPAYTYGKEQWLAESDARQKERAMIDSHAMNIHFSR